MNGKDSIKDLMNIVDEALLNHEQQTKTNVLPGNEPGELSSFVNPDALDALQKFKLEHSPS